MLSTDSSPEFLGRRTEPADVTTNRNAGTVISPDAGGAFCGMLRFRGVRCSPAGSINASRLARPKELFHIKRIVIPAAPRIFSPEMIDGMIQYAADGGLIITESIMNGIDANGDFREDFSLFQAPAKRKKSHPRPNGWPPSGVIAHSSMKIESVTAVIECPLSKGFTVNKPMSVSFSFRNVIRADGNVIFTASAVTRNGRRKGSMPLASVYNVGKGTFVFIPFQIETLVKNALSAETLDWLTDQE